jgi:ABC-type transport system involved in cytochrome c biogenesis permease component
MNMKNYTMIALFAFALFGNIVFATTTGLVGALNSIKSQIESIIPVVALMMIVLAGLIYGIGQVMGAEMRGRAAVWAQALLIGAILGLVIAAMAGPLVGLFSGAALITTP